MQIRIELKIGSLDIRVNYLIAACVFITIASFVRLGIWQLDRAAEKFEAQQALEAELNGNASPIEEIPNAHLHRANPELQNRYVELTGEFVNDRAILLLAQFFDGQIGYGVVTPFRLQSNGQLVLIARGWTSGILPPNTPPNLRSVAGQLSVTAQIHVPEENARVFPSRVEQDTWPLRLRSLELDVIADILGQELFPFEVRLTEGQPGVLVRHWPAVSPDVNTNLSYALQWFTFALIVLFASLLASSNLWSLIRGPDED